LLGCVLRLKIFLDNPSFWFDESALGYNVLNLNYKYFFGILHLQQVAPPLFLVLSKFIINLIGASDIHLRLLPFIFGNLSMILFLMLLKQNFKNRLTILSGLILFCLNIQLIKYSIEFKPYIIEVFVSCIMLYLLCKFDWDWSYKKLFFIGVGLSILPWFAFVSAIMLVAFYTVIFSIKYIKKWMLFFAPSVLSFILIAFYYFNINNFYSAFMEDFFNDCFFDYSSFIILLLKNMFFLFSLKFTIFPLLLIICSLIYYLLSKKYNYSLTFAVLVIFFSIFLSYFHKYPCFQRFILYLYPMLILVILNCIDKIYSFKKYYLSVISIAIICFISCPSVNFIKNIATEKFNKKDYARELFIDLSSRVSSSDIIIVDTLSTPDFLYYNSYFHLNNKIKFNINVKNGVIMYKYDKGVTLPIEKNENYWFYSPWSSGKYGYLKSDYVNKCKYGGKLLYFKGNKQ